MTKIRRITFLAIALAWVFVAAAEPMHVYRTFSGAPETSIDINVMLKDKVNTRAKRSLACRMSASLRRCQVGTSRFASWMAATWAQTD